MCFAALLLHNTSSGLGRQIVSAQARLRGRYGLLLALEVGTIDVPLACGLWTAKTLCCVLERTTTAVLMNAGRHSMDGWLEDLLADALELPNTNAGTGTEIFA